nr:MAG TPA: hypothetical protein [Caudoviricetes sp.]
MTLTVVYALCISMCLKSTKNRLLVRVVFFCVKAIKKTGCICPLHLLSCFHCIFYHSYCC